jgi:hypothetical protein
MYLREIVALPQDTLVMHLEIAVTHPVVVKTHRLAWMA